MTTFKQSIVDFGSMLDCKMILNELYEQLEEVIIDKTTLKLVQAHLNNKQREVEERYKR